MEISAHALWTLIHGMGFGALYLLACSGAAVELWRHYGRIAGESVNARNETFLRVYLGAMALLAWLTVLSGAYIVYPWYRATAPAGTVQLAGYPQALLQSSSATSAWHSIGMEWKEHVAWLAPISITMAAAVFVQYGRSIRTQPQLRNAVLCFVLISFLAAGIAGFFGAMIDKNAPVEGGRVIQLIDGGSR
jgi:hypothetical protein